MSGVVVIGTAVVDVIGYADRRPRDGETVVGTGYEVAAGGKGLNQAVAAARAGARVSLMAAIGPDDFGRRLQAVLDADAIDSSAVLVREDLATGVGLPVVTARGENSIVVVPGASAAIGDDHFGWMASAVTRGTVFLSQSELPSLVVAEAIARASRLGARVVLNPAPAGDLTHALDHVEVLVPNEHEAEDLTGIASPEKAALELARQKEGLSVVVTCGGEGAVVVAESGVTWLAAPVVEVVDTVGAGDVFCGYLAAALAQGMTVEESAEQAVRAASVSVGRRGAATSAPYQSELAE